MINLNDENHRELTAAQRQVFECSARFRVLVAGRRFGKTYLALTEIIKVGLQRNRLIWYIGPNDGQANRIVWDRLKAATKDRWAKRPNETKSRIDLTSGSTIIVSGAFNPDSLRGDGLDFVVLDEYASIKPATWSDVLRPALADRQGRALFIGTPQGRNHFYERFEYAHNDPDWQPFQFTTAEGGLVTEAELSGAARDLDPESYSQEFCAQFVTTERNRVYYTFDPALHVKPLTFDPLYPLVWAVDFNVNPMCMLLIQCVQDVIHVFDEIILANGHTEAACKALVERIAPLAKTVPFMQQPMEVRIHGDASGHQRRTSAVDTDWQIIRRSFDHWKGVYRAFMFTSTVNPAVRDRINCVNSRLRSHDHTTRLFIDPRCRQLIKDLTEVAWATDSTGAATSDIDKSDRNRTHCSDALGYYIAHAFPLKPLIGHNSSGRLL